MGSKKHKDKDKEHKRKHKHRSKSKEKHRSKRSRAEKEERRARKKAAEAYLYDPDRHNDQIDSGVTEIDYGHGYKQYQAVESIQNKSGLMQDAAVIKQEPLSEDEGPVIQQDASHSSLSIEDTNKLRAKLGLKPLDVSSSAVKAEDDEEQKKKSDVHVPAINIRETKKTEKLRERVEDSKQKRSYETKLSKVKGLGDSDSEGDDTVAWIQKSRLLQRERELAAAREKILDEMDDEFGLSEIVNEEFKKDGTKDYSSTDLRGLTIQHSAERFKEGKSVILTLEDKKILDDDGDVLVNVNMVDDEFIDKKLEDIKKGAAYNPYEEEIDAGTGLPRPAKLLSKYDETISGMKKDSFTLGSTGKYDNIESRMKAEMRQNLQNQQESLVLGTPQLARDYYTTEEMTAKFKKVKKKRKVRSRGVVKADDLVPEETNDQDFGSRSRGRGLNVEDDPVLDDQAESQAVYTYYGTNSSGVTWPSNNPPTTAPSDCVANDSDSDSGPVEDLSNVVVTDPDDVTSELQASLDKTRRLKQLSSSKKPDEVVMKRLRKFDNDVAMEKKGRNLIELNSISEFCRSLGDIPTYGMSGNREDDEDLMDLEDDAKDMDDPYTGWNEVDVEHKRANILEDEDNILDDEPVVNKGLSTALALAVNKGYLDNEVTKTHSAKQLSKIQVQNYSIEDKRYDDLDEKVHKRERDRYSSSLMDFKEKVGYRPDIKLEYMDDKGNLLDHKEAFRYLSHRFHGKGSGKKKTEKRSRKADDEMLMKQMSSTDTPLGTLNLLKEKQKSEKSPYVILTGVSSNKAFMANTITK